MNNEQRQIQIAEILKLAAKGMTNVAIAKEMKISVSRVRFLKKHNGS